MIERTLMPMKSVILGVLLLAAFTLTVPDSLSQTKQEVRVPDEATALKIAEPALIKTYGKRQIDDERPLTATLDKGIWTVAGSLCCSDRNGHRTCEQQMCVGGVAVLKLRQRDGKILSIIHYK
jgi:hypothetical protein